MSVTLHKIDCIIKRLVDQSTLIEQAHTELGVPLEDCIDSTVRLAMKQMEANPAQLDLFCREKINVQADRQ